MSTAVISGDPTFGPWVVPHRLQNVFTNAYAREQGLTVDTVIPEPIFSDALLTTQWISKHWSLDRILLCSFLQLPHKPEDMERLIDNLENVEFHFILENLVGTGRNFLGQAFRNAQAFRNTSSLKHAEIECYDDLYRMMREAPLPNGTEIRQPANFDQSNDAKD